MYAFVGHQTAGLGFVGCFVNNVRRSEERTNSCCVFYSGYHRRLQTIRNGKIFKEGLGKLVDLP